MHKKKYDKDKADQKMRRLIIRNWAIMFVSLALIILCYYFIK